MEHSVDWVCDVMPVTRGCFLVACRSTFDIGTAREGFVGGNVLPRGSSDPFCCIIHHSMAFSLQRSCWSQWCHGHNIRASSIRNVLPNSSQGKPTGASTSKKSVHVVHQKECKVENCVRWTCGMHSFVQSICKTDCSGETMIARSIKRSWCKWMVNSS